MATVDPTVLTKDTWVLVLSDVTNEGQVIILDQEQEPNSYKIAKVQPVGAGAPASDYDGGVEVEFSFKPNNTSPMDVYMKAENYDGKVVIYE